MKMFKRTFLIVGIHCLVWSASQAFGGATKVFILSGQSNMHGLGKVNELGDLSKYTFPNITMYSALGKADHDTTIHPLAPGNSHYPDEQLDPSSIFGPEIGIAQVLSQSFPKEDLIFIKIAWGGSSLQNDWLLNTTNVYGWFKERLFEALHKISGTFKICGMIWMQGESDACDPDMAQNYASNLKTFVNSKIRADLGIPNLPFVYGVIHWTTYPDGRKNWTFGPMVQDQQKIAQSMIANVKCVTETANAEVWSNSDANSSEFNLGFNINHYSTQGQLKVGEYLGQGMVDLYQEILKKQSASLNIVYFLLND